MKVGFHHPQWGADATRHGVLSVARTVEDCGLDSVWVADHIVMPVNSNSQYPYAESTSFTPEAGFLDALTALSVVAGATERVNVGTSVFVLPLRYPIAAAKAVGTLDVSRGGRAILAVGAGWLEKEFVALDQRFPQRGKRFDEQIRIARRCGPMASRSSPATSTGSGQWPASPAGRRPSPANRRDGTGRLAASCSPRGRVACRRCPRGRVGGRDARDRRACRGAGPRSCRGNPQHLDGSRLGRCAGFPVFIGWERPMLSWRRVLRTRTAPADESNTSPRPCCPAARVGRSGVAVQ